MNHKKDKILKELFPLTLDIKKEDGEIVFSSKVSIPLLKKILPEIMAAEICNVQPLKDIE